MKKWVRSKEISNYEVDSNGCVRNASSKKVLKHFLNPKGYHLVTLYENGKPHTTKVHHLVAEAFCEKKPESNQVNHKDGNKDNNSFHNLEWCNGSENIIHAYHTGLRKPPRMKKVRVVETGSVYESMSECARDIGGTVNGIYDCLKGRQETHRGYHFKEEN